MIWKDVEKELPKKQREYLVTVYIYTEFGSWRECRTAFYEVKKNNWIVRQNKSIFEVASQPIAWMELPLPYEEDSE